MKLEKWFWRVFSCQKVRSFFLPDLYIWFSINRISYLNLKFYAMIGYYESLTKNGALQLSHGFLWLLVVTFNNWRNKYASTHWSFIVYYAYKLNFFEIFKQVRIWIIGMKSLGMLLLQKPAGSILLREGTKGRLIVMCSCSATWGVLGWNVSSSLRYALLVFVI